MGGENEGFVARFAVLCGVDKEDERHLEKK